MPVYENCGCGEIDFSFLNFEYGLFRCAKKRLCANEFFKKVI
jgi:hypothetical protein